MRAVEVNFDGLIGPTHNYAGLSEGNLAATKNKDLISQPRQAALQGVAKMRRMMRLGFVQGVLPPQERPNISWLRGLGFNGSDEDVWSRAWRDAPALARCAASASSMWAANAATISPSADCADGRLHASPANLLTMLHRSQEAETTTRLLKSMLRNDARFCVHEPLPAHDAFADEGAANHMRLCADQGAQGVEIFVYGRVAAAGAATRFPGRQTLESVEALARRHQLNASRTCFVRQSAGAIDAGAFHNDVVAVSHETTLFYHARAFDDRDAAIADIRAKAAGLFEPVFIEVPDEAVSLQDAVHSYLFNAQLVRAPGHETLTLIAPIETRENNRTAAYVSDLIASGGPIGAVDYVDVRESMRNGGGPACLRLRIAMTDAERAAAAQGFFLTESLADALEAWVRAHYRETLAPDDLGDPALVRETQAALDALTAILPLGAGFYAFQRA